MATIDRFSASQAVAELMPNIIRGVQLDFFLRRRITQTQLLVLLAVRAYGRCTMGTLANSLHVRMPTTTGIVGRLLKAGLLRRYPHPEDRRQVLVELTPKGRSFIQRFQGVIRHRWQEVLRSLGPGELSAFYHVVTKLRDRLQQGTSP